MSDHELPENYGVTESDFDKLRKKLLPIDGEREGGPMRFESTPGDGPNPYYERFFKRMEE